MTYSLVGPIRYMVGIELVLALLVIFITLFNPRYFTRISWPRQLTPVFPYKRLSIAFAIAFPLTVRGLLVPVYPPPPPIVPDDFSYRFLGETFALGRVANPTPPLAEHFEAMFQFVSPTFSSQYQPAQGVAIAIGKLIAGNGWWGIYLSAGFFFGCLCWALQGALPVKWAFFGTAICIVQFGVFGIFMNTFRSATVSAIGGAIVFGIAARLRKKRKGSFRYGAAGAFGVLLIAGGRPVEAMIWFLIFCWVAYFTPSVRLRLISAFVITLVPGLLLLGWYDLRVTGHPLHLPYVHYQKLYGTQGFWWQQAAHLPPTVGLNEFRMEYDLQFRLHQQQKHLAQLASNLAERFSRAWEFFVGPILTIPLLFFPGILQAKRNRFWLVILVPFLIDHLTFHTWYPNQSAPEYVLFAFVAVQCWRYMRCLTLRGKRIGRSFSSGLAFAGLVTFCIPIAGKLSEPFLPGRLAKAKAVWYCEFIHEDRRASVVAYLERQSTKRHIVFVPWRTIRNSDFQQWLYNDPDLKSANVIWSRSLDLDSDRKLAAMFSGRDTWLLIQAGTEKVPAALSHYDLLTSHTPVRYDFP